MPEIVVHEQWSWPGVVAGVVCGGTLSIHMDETPSSVFIWIRLRSVEGWQHIRMDPSAYTVTFCDHTLRIQFKYFKTSWMSDSASCTVVVDDWYSPVLLLRRRVPDSPQLAMQQIMCGTSSAYRDDLVTVMDAPLSMCKYLDCKEYLTLHVKPVMQSVRKWLRVQPLRLISLGKRDARGQLIARPIS